MNQQTIDYEIWQDDMMVASVSGLPENKHRSFNEAVNYARQYVQDGPVQMFEVTRTPIVFPKGFFK